MLGKNVWQHVLYLTHLNHYLIGFLNFIDFYDQASMYYMCWRTHIWINKLLSVVKFSKFTCTIVTVKLAQTFQQTSELGWTKFIHNLFNWKIYIHNLNFWDGYIFPSIFDIQNVIKLKIRVDSYIKFKLIELSFVHSNIYKIF